MKKIYHYEKPKQEPEAKIKIQIENEERQVTQFDDFNLFFSDNQQEFDGHISTLMLNKKYKIPGYKIGYLLNKETNKREYKLIKEKVKATDKEKEMEEIKNSINELSARFTKLVERLIELEVLN